MCNWRTVDLKSQLVCLALNGCLCVFMRPLTSTWNLDCVVYGIVIVMSSAASVSGSYSAPRSCHSCFLFAPVALTGTTNCARARLCRVDWTSNEYSVIYNILMTYIINVYIVLHELYTIFADALKFCCLSIIHKYLVYFHNYCIITKYLKLFFNMLILVTSFK